MKKSHYDGNNNVNLIKTLTFCLQSKKFKTYDFH